MLLHRNDIRDLHATTTNEQYFSFSVLHNFSVSSFDFDLIAVTVMLFCVSMSIPHFTHIGSPVLSIIKMVAVATQCYVWFRIWSRYTHQEAKIY